MKQACKSMRELMNPRCVLFFLNLFRNFSNACYGMQFFIHLVRYLFFHPDAFFGQVLGEPFKSEDLSYTLCKGNTTSKLREEES